jgi:hypothetical protein
MRTTWCRLALGLFLSLFSVSCLDLGTCGTEIKSEVLSPSGKYVGRVIEINCGATTAFNTVVSIDQRGEKFELKKSQGVVLSVIRERPRIDVFWINDDALGIDCKECNEKNIYFSETASKSVAVVYGRVSFSKDGKFPIKPKKKK